MNIVAYREDEDNRYIRIVLTDNHGYLWYSGEMDRPTANRVLARVAQDHPDAKKVQGRYSPT